MDALRGAALLLIVVGHAGLQLDAIRAVSGLGFAAVPFEFGLGTDLLLVLAGLFAVRTDARVGARLYRRAVRIVPLYWLMSTFVLLIHWRDMIAPGKLLASYLFIPWQNADGSFFPIVDPGWTLFYIVPFYLVAALAMRRDADKAAVVLASAIGAVVILGLVADRHDVALPPAIHFLTRPILIDLAFGLMIGRWLRTGRVLSPPARMSLFVAGLAIYLAGHRIDDVEGARALLLGLPAALFVLAAIGPMPVWRLCAFFQKIGGAGYSIYLTNVQLLHIVGTLWLAMIGAQWLAMFAIVGTIAAVAAGLLVHETIDRPLTAIFRRNHVTQRKVLTLT